MSDARHSTRREFLKQTGAVGAAFAAPYVITSTALGGEGRPAASERIVMGGIGIGQQGGGDQGSFLRRNEVQYVAACDVKESVRNRCLQQINSRYGNSDAKVYNDFRELLARPDIDAVHIGTPDHWHAILVIEACRSGKDVYCQKPESHCLRQGRLMVEAARRYGRMVSGGSQRVAEDTRRLNQFAWSGQLGEIKEIYVGCGRPSTPCYLGGGEEVPAGFDWNMWLGPAPWAPYHPYRCDGNFSINGTSWRSWQDYSGGGMTDWGAHRFGGGMFAAGIADQGPVEIIPPDGKDVRHLTYVFANGIRMYHCPNEGDARVSGPGMANESSIGLVGTGEPIEAKPMPGYKGTGGIYGDFLASVKTREIPFRDMEVSHRAVSICHLGIIAYDLNRPLKWDPEKEVFPNDEEANRLLNHAMREPWQI